MLLVCTETRATGIALDCVWLDFGPAADRARQAKPRMRGGRKEDWRLPRLAMFGLEEAGRACVGPDGDVEDATAKQVQRRENHWCAWFCLPYA